jgi:DNA-binding beta-propeller fold protein YncE
MTVSGGAARLAALLALLVAAAGCASSGPARPHSPLASPAVAVPVGSVSRTLPGCTTAAQAGPKLPASATAMAALLPPGSPASGPFGVAVAAAGNWGFATALPVGSGEGLSNESAVDVLRLALGHAPVLVRSVAVPGTTAGAALTQNGRLLLVADGAGAAVISAPVAERGGRQAVLGTLAGPAGPGANSAGQVAMTPDGRYAFVSLEDAGRIAVFNLARALAHGFRAAGVYVGSIPMQVAPTGLAVSPDGQWLYAASEFASATSSTGSLSVVSVARAESHPARSVVATVPAGCSPVRVITSADGSVVWVTDRGSNALLAFSAAAPPAKPAPALLADVRVGQAPVGLALAEAGALMVVADSDRFAPGIPTSNLAVVDVADALHSRPALLGYLPAGLFPRDVAASASGSILLVANYESGQAEAIDAAALP